jgi:acetyltransferase
MSSLEPSTGSASGRYPTHLIDGWRSRRGEQFVLRPLLPQDRSLLQDFYAALSPASRRLRFHGAVNELTPAALDRMTDVDHARHEALVVTFVSEACEIIVAEARFAVDETGRSGEFAIAVADAWQRRGIATRVIEGLCKAARLQGLGWIRGEILEGNAAMLALVERAGFCRSSQSREGIVRVERSVAAGAVRPVARRRLSLALFTQWLSADGLRA